MLATTGGNARIIHNVSREEMQELLAKLEAKSEKQAPYFDDRLLCQIENIKEGLERLK